MDQAKWGGAKGWAGQQTDKRDSAALDRWQSCQHVLKCVISGNISHWKDGLTVHFVVVDFLGACTFVAFGDDLTPPGLVLLLADVLVKQAV